MKTKTRDGGINAEKLRAYREQLKLSQNKLDIKAGVGNRTTRNAEMGKGLSVASLKAIARALGVPPAVFLD